MKGQAFIGRKTELAELESAYSARPCVVSVNGGPRTGKTSLIREFLRGKEYCYLSALRQPADLNLKEFCDHLSMCTGTDAKSRDWFVLFRIIAGSGKDVLVLDNFSELTRRDPSISETVFGAFREYLSPNGMMLVLCGSDDVPDSRVGIHIRLEPFRFSELRFFDDEASFRRSLEMYSVTGGMLGCIRALSVSGDPEDAILDRDGSFLREYDDIIRSSPGDGGRARGILKSMADGDAKLSEIAEKLGVSGNSLSPYLKALEDAGIIERRVPVTESDPRSSRLGRYRIVNPYIRFYCRFISPHLSSLELDEHGPILNDLKMHFRDHAEGVFRDVCSESVSEHISGTIGTYRRGDVKIDVLALDRAGRRAFAGVCRYREDPVGTDALEELRAAVAKVPELEGFAVEYGVFSASGFDEGLRSVAGDVKLVDFESFCIV